MNTNFRYKALSGNDGTNQLERMLPALDPSYAKADERTLPDFLKYVYELAKEIRYFNLENIEAGDWTPFFDYFLQQTSPGRWEIRPEAEINEILDKHSDLPPHLVLLLTFLKLFKYAQQDINGITKKHLDYYYRDILGIKPKPAVPDRVHVVFELAKHLSEYRVPGGTLLDAGKDDRGKPIRLRTDREVVINKAKVVSLKTLFLEATKLKGTLLQVTSQADSADGKGKPFEGSPAWRPFGEAQAEKADSEKSMSPGTIGFAISSPLLFLKEGYRTITVSVEVDSNGTNDTSLIHAFKLYLSGEKEWIEVTQITGMNLTTKSAKQYLLISAVLSLVQPPVVAYNINILKDSFVTPNPVLKLVLNQESSRYDVVRNLKILSIALTVAVSGVKDLVVQNDESVVDVNKPFMPFGSQPAIGSNFYIGSNEVFTKRLTALDLHIEWNKLPADLRSYYAGYFYGANPIKNINYFSSVFYFLQNKEWQPLLTNPLFKGADYKNGDITIDYTAFENFDQKTTSHEENLQGFNQNVKNGFVRLELTDPVIESAGFEAFGHAIFPTVYAQKAVELSKYVPSPGLAAPVLPNQPYTPQIKSLSVDYTAEETFRPDALDAVNSFWLIGPFGSRQVMENEQSGVLPVIDGAAHLYAGLKDFEPPHTISLLFQIEDGTSRAAVPGDVTGAKDITWSYLSVDHWVDIKGADILAESTEGFQKSGIVMLAIGRDASANHTLMPAGMHWIRARLNTSAKTTGASNVISIRTQAVAATLVQVIPDTIQLTKGLVAGTIKKMVSPLTAIQKVEQPFASFGGRSDENDHSYYTRVSERLKHKNRLSGGWDYEHFILQAFPAVFKVRCLAQLTPELLEEYRKLEPNYETPEPGSVQIIVVPDLRYKNYGNPLEPRCSTILLREIEEYVKAYTSPFVTVKVSNPVYEQIMLDFKVAFMPGRDAGFYAVVLNEDIKRFLSPWAYEEGRDIPFGGKVYKSDLLEFVEGREYVDFVTDFTMYHIYQGNTRGGIGFLTINKDLVIIHQVPATIDTTNGTAISEDFIVGSPVDSTTESPVVPAIIVSASQHRITPLSLGDQICSISGERSGISYMIVGLDFDVTQSKTKII